MPRNLTLEPKYVEALNRWQLYISPMLSSTGKPQRLFYRTKRAAETAAEVFERRQKNFGCNLSELTPAHMAIAAEAFELLGDRDDVALLEIVRAGLAHENAKTASVPFRNLFDALALLPFLVLALFCGVRPGGELEKLT